MTESPVPLTQRRRRPRLAEHDLRQDMYRAAQQLVYQMGVTISLEDLGFEDVIRMAGVPRSSAYRIWPYKGDFVGDLLTYLAGPNWLGTAAFDEQTVLDAESIVAENAHRLVDAGGRRAVLEETVRRAVAQNFSAIVESKEWHIYVALVATVQTTRDDNARANVTAALVNSEVHFVRRMSEFYERMMQILGIRLQHPLGVDHMATAGAALVEGLALRKILLESAAALPEGNLTDDQRGNTERLRSYLDVVIVRPGLDGEPADWSLPALAFLGILDALREPDTRNDPVKS